MRILLINQYAGAPSLGMEYRPHWMSLEWQKLGHEVLVVAGDHSHLRRAQPPRATPPWRGSTSSPWALPPTRRTGRVGSRTSWPSEPSCDATPRTLRSWSPDVVIASSTHPMDVRPALHLARSCGAVLVHEVHDLWPLTPKLLGGMSDRHPMIAWMQREEDLACREADLVVSMLPATLPYLQSRGLDADRWAYVSNGVPVEAVMDAVAAPPDDGVFRVGYFGAHGPANDLGTLIEAARLLRDDEGIEFHLTGSGPLKAELKEQASELDHVHFHDAVSPDESRRMMQQMDALYIGLAHSELFEHGVSPNKMFDYMAAGRPVVQAISTPASPAELAGCTVTCAPGSPTEVARVIVDMAAQTPQARARLGAAGRAYVAGVATYPVLAKTFLDAVGGASGMA